MSSVKNAAEISGAASGSGAEDFDEWERVREDGEAPQASEAAPELSVAEAERTEQDAPETFQSVQASALGPVAIDISHDPLASEKLRILGGDTIESCFEIANILHLNRNVQEAAYFYRRAFDLHDKVPTHFPTAPVLLQVSLLCKLKAGENLASEELAELERYCIPFADYIRGMEKAWRQGDYEGAFRQIGNAYEEFHTGEEVDSLTLEVMRRLYGEWLIPQGDRPQKRIPKNIFLYWDANPPPEIDENFRRHREIEGFNVQIFDKERAANWLYQYYGVEARSMFLSARHPAEAADFLRVHVINLLGGWWLDADLRINGPEALKMMAEETAGTALFLTHNNVVHNDFFGSVPNSELLNDCLLSLYRNGYQHSGLYIAYKTGPGIFNRALNRLMHRLVNGMEISTSMRVRDHEAFPVWTEEFDTPYKHNLPSWHAA
ncbi:glycosyltransferase family 32 protein [Oecophyllibacter saccharovorans]|uniref:hypothetical protein n=1 Tax=Oecophyllibacter saccharovorans TaxID=2558360 RepID=UPI00116D9255|nr:hypothetical protein [Oecophyllibacter saccharovorans]TPW36300.1 hypothetical protein E3203_00405 [Oecophyllibacter saccharovorans]